ncbi:Phox homologous domain-containing protein [Roridomyces roridus]|uniref:Phox homologous domain-containing protein n=1 Tax=Roridomyces roridus TaxID=1738132 RepID=A0AAD7FX74_9AGAR|nr:Phox homologous domain-containing protein [Roridomyces roridus]
MSLVVKSAGHTTSSKPRPHILYRFQVLEDGRELSQLHKRFSEFLTLHKTLRPNRPGCSLPPKRVLVTTFIPSAWLDDILISERKHALTAYLNALLAVPKYREDPVLMDFLNPPASDPLAPSSEFDLEDALPSTLSRRAARDLGAVVAMPVVTPPESVDARSFVSTSTSPSRVPIPPIPIAAPTPTRPQAKSRSSSKARGSSRPQTPKPSKSSGGGSSGAKPKKKATKHNG